MPRISSNSCLIFIYTLFFALVQAVAGHPRTFSANFAPILAKNFLFWG